MSNIEAQENNLTPQVENAVEPPQNTDETLEVSATVEPIVAEENTSISRSREELVAELRMLLVNPVVENIKSSVEALKQAFYKQKKAEVVAENENADEVDAVEEEFKALLSKYKELKAVANAVVAEQKENNLKLKQAILDKLEELTNSADDLSTTIPAFRKLQQEWKSIDQVPQEAVTPLWREYNRYQEKFYDLIRINNELREYDFKKNLELKNSLCLAAEKLNEEPNAVIAFNTLQKLHEEWREVGPVAQEVRESIWARFKAASSVINKKHQAHFESIKEQEQENLAKKTVLCQKAEEIGIEDVQTRRDWEVKTEEMLGLQQEWKTIGFATKKHNAKIFKRFREACDKFFKARNTAYKDMKEALSQNLAKRKELLAEAESLKDVENIQEAIERVKQLNKDWKAVGVSPKKATDVVWEKFSAACDAVFEKKSVLNQEQQTEQQENLNQKKAMVQKAKDLVLTGEKDTDIVSLKELMAEYEAIGFVPIKDKRVINADFKYAIDCRFDEVFGRKSAARKTPISTADKKYLKAYEDLKKEIASYENNIQFLTASSKKGNALVDEMHKKVEILKDNLAELSEKMNATE